MDYIFIPDPYFRTAVAAIGLGDIGTLESILILRPALVAQRLGFPIDGYFARPYLLWFVADNPVRFGRLPDNITEITALLINKIRVHYPDSVSQQVQGVAGLVETGRVARESGLQIALLELFINNGAQPGNGLAALMNRNIEAAAYLIGKSGRITLAAAVSLERMDDVGRLLPTAAPHEKQVALIAAAFYGRPEMIRLLLAAGVDVNFFVDSGFQTHGTALHQAVASGSLESVRLLVAAGADKSIRDTVYDGTPVDWAIFLQREGDKKKNEHYRALEKYLTAFQ